MAEKLGRHRSTIFRELRRNWFEDSELPGVVGYFAFAAHTVSANRRHRMRKLVRYPELRDAVIERIRHGWSPEQIAGRLAHERHTVRVCHETIYRFAHSKDGREMNLWRVLPERRVRRRPRHARRRHERRFAPEISILNRPDIVRDRQQIGHWECDLMQFRKSFGTANVTSLVERVSRFTVIVQNNDRQSRNIMERLIEVLSPLPAEARRSITFDRGTEFADWRYLQAGLGVRTWFCDLKAPWQKGTVENTNWRARRWLPRETDLLSLRNGDLARVCAQLNATPRKCLGYRTPVEVFREGVLAISR
ncbi:transposase, IS1086 [Stappia sp. 22II-S9-Z10]|nr:transposase, IS1086 [Stappia sp. 22II-S9-Z10]